MVEKETVRERERSLARKAKKFVKVYRGKQK